MNKKFVYQVGNNKKVIIASQLYMFRVVFAHHQEHLTVFTVSGSIQCNNNFF